jgi:D-lactate dehydrogenase (cytochrome)
MKYLPAEHCLLGLQTMETIKRALDPHNIMNPGKILTLN